MRKSFKRFIFLGAPAIAAALSIFSWPAAEAQQPPFPVAPQAPPLQAPLSYPVPQSPQFPIQAPVFQQPQPPVQTLVFQQPQPAGVQPQPAAAEASRDSQPQTVTVVEVLHVQRNLYFGFSPADYSEAGNLGDDYGLTRRDPYSLKADLNLFTFRYALEFSKYSEIVFGIHHSQQQDLLLGEDQQIENTLTSLSFAAKEKLPLPFKTAIYGYLGVAYSEFAQNVSSSNTTDDPITPPQLDGLSPIYGAGIEWDLLDNLGIFLEYGRFYEQERKTQNRRPKAIAEGLIFGLFVRF